jgi:hypothetical protein
MEPVRQTAMHYLKNRIHKRNGMERTMIQRSGKSNLNRDTLDGVVIALR